MGSKYTPPTGSISFNEKQSQGAQPQAKRRTRKLDTEFQQLQEMQQVKRKQKMIVVANRLPTKPKRDNEGNWTFEKCSGGLVSCLAGIQGRFDMVWLGWPGTEVADRDKGYIIEEAMKQNCYPVFLPNKLVDDYYNGFSNNVLWPLLHYVMPPFERPENVQMQWEAYRKANKLFTDAILQVYEEDDYVWVHDYHLMLVPKMLRDAKPDCNIGWFLHTPFPAIEIYRTLPLREARQEIIESLLHANLLGFHAYDYLRHFLSSCVRLTSLEISAHSVDATSIGGCMVTCATVPIGISPSDFEAALATPHVKEQIEYLRDLYGGRKVILGVDRLDYMKGIPHKLMAFGTFLDDHPDYAQRCVLVQLAVPSRREVPEYQRLQRQVHELVGQVCGKHSNIKTGAPVIYLDQSMSFLDLVALYHVADVALITSLRDGMNLVSYEFVACHHRKDPPGVLVLSEFAGAAHTIGASCLRVNPWDIQETADAIHDALEMLPQDRKALHRYAYQYITDHTAQKWAEAFLQGMQEACGGQVQIPAEVPPLLPHEELLSKWAESSHRLVILDLLEFLTPMGRNYHLPTEIYHCLDSLATHPGTTVIITSDKPRAVLDLVVGNLPVIQAAESCCWYKRPQQKEWHCLINADEGDAEVRTDWMDSVKEFFTYFSERTPGSYVEKQDFQLRWCWDTSMSDFGSSQAREVLAHLWAGPLVNSEAEVVVGDNCLTVRPHACSRSRNLETLLINEIGEEELQKLDFVMCFAVVSHRDEDVFETLQNISTPLEAENESDWEGPDPSPRSEISPSGRRDPSRLAPPRHAPPPVDEGEEPPLYDWVPTATRERLEMEAAAAKEAHEVVNGEDAEDDDDEEAKKPAEAPLVFKPKTERPSFCTCYTISLGLKKTKAKHTLPSAYHMQNLIRAMASRLPDDRQESRGRAGSWRQSAEGGA